MKRRNFFSLALLALSCLGAGNAWAWEEPTQIDGVYQIGTGSELEWFAEKVNALKPESTDEEKAILKAKVVLTDDIDMTGIDHAPIGAIEQCKFEGDFDGQFHTIKNLVINRPNDSQIGLFGWVRGNACIKNVIIDSSCSFTGFNRVGALIGVVQTNVGTSDPLEVLNCVNYADVTATSGAAASMMGAGANQYPYFEMMNCVNAGKITGANKGAAFQGWNKSAGGNAKLWNCLNIAEVSVLDGTNNLFRGQNRSIANNYDMVYTGSQYQGEHPTWKTADPLHSGELCYLLNNALREDLKSGQNAGIVSFKQDLDDPNSIPLPIPNGKVVYQRATYNCDGTPNGEVEYTNEETAVVIPPHDFNEKTGFCTYCSKINENWKSPEADGFYHLSTVEDVEWFSHMVRDAKHGAMKVKLDNDIDFGGVANAHLPIGASAQKFFGHFDGQGHTIKGMVLTTGSKLNDRVYDGQGFFGSVRGGGTDANGTVNNEVIIENLYIDSSCSIEHDNNFAAGIVAHVNSRNDDNSMIIIRNCGNEANVYTTGKQAAGILGCVEGTKVGLQIINCWNKGNITGLAGESAAICGWTGTAAEGITKVAKGCWNIGEVTGIDGNGYNMFRVGKIGDTLSPTPENIVDLCQTNGGNQGKVTINTANPIASGELCYLLNGDQSEIVFTQTIGSEELPNVFGKTDRVRYVGDAGYATLCNASEFALKGDVQASIITGAEGTKLVQKYVNNVPAKEGVLLEGTYYNIIATTGSTDDCSGNKLVGVTEDKTAKAGTYVLQDNDGKVGFYLVATGEEPTIKAGKAYLQLSGNEAKALFLEGDGATGITEMAETATDGDAEVYNLAGQRVSKAAKGIYIVGGKKVLK